MIPFNVPMVCDNEMNYIRNVLDSRKFCGDGEYSKKCHSWLEKNIHCKKALLTTSCTHALEMAAILTDIGVGDEVILPSYTFPSTGNAFALRGAKLVFVDIKPETMNIDETLIEEAITDRTKAIVVVHYAGVACDMNAICTVARNKGIPVVEDAAQALMSKYKGKFLGTFGDFGCISFHETKNIQCGEGGALLVNDSRLIERAEYIREKGTNRSRFWRGEIDKYTWVDMGSSYLPSELNAAFLFAQLETARDITNKRLELWNLYHAELRKLEEIGVLHLPVVPEECEHNGHMFYIKTKDLAERTRLIGHLKNNGVNAVFHYVPLHLSPFGTKCGRFFKTDEWTSRESEKLLRLPMYYQLTHDEVRTVAKLIYDFYTVKYD